MAFLSAISTWIIPSFLLIVLITAYMKKIPSYELFVEGGKEGVKLAFSLLPFFSWNARCHFHFAKLRGVGCFYPAYFPVVDEGWDSAGHNTISVSSANFRQCSIGSYDRNHFYPRTRLVYRNIGIDHPRKYRYDPLYTYGLLRCRRDKEDGLCAKSWTFSRFGWYNCIGNYCYNYVWIN